LKSVKEIAKRGRHVLIKTIAVDEPQRVACSKCEPIPCLGVASLSACQVCAQESTDVVMLGSGVVEVLSDAVVAFHLLEGEVLVGG
jgi:hypothetical protein